MKNINLKVFSEKEILNDYLVISSIPKNYGLETLKNKNPDAFDVLLKVSEEKDILVKDIRKTYDRYYQYYISEEWKNYKNINDEKSAISFLNSFRFVYTREEYFRNNYPKIFDYVDKEKNESWESFIYRCKNNISEIPKCPYCNKPCKFINKNIGFAKDCSNKECHKKVLQSIWNEKTLEEKEQKLKKFKETSLKKYGVENPNKCRQVREKIEQTNLRRYGVKYTTQSEEAKRKKEETFLRKYGVKNPNMVPEIKAKGIQTCLNRYGVPNPNQASIARKSTLERYGVENYNWLHLPPETPIIIHDKEKLKNYLLERQDKTVIEIAKDLGVSSYSLWKRIHQFELDSYIKTTRTSTPEKKLKDYISNIYSGPIILNNKKIIPPYELDIYLPDRNLAFEFNGNYWHSEEMLSDKGITPKLYHQYKTLECRKKNIQLIHIFEYEWNDPIIQNKIKSLINFLINGSPHRIYARDCSIKEITYKEAKEFLDRNHLQGSVQSSVNLGLTFNNKLIEVMTFSHPRFNKKYEWELMRLASEKYYQVIGGASKLFSYFIKNYSPSSIISYCNLSKMSGKVYEKLGFNLKDISDPNYIWIKGNDILTRYQCQKHKLLSEGYEGESEFNIMTKRGYSKLYDCGNLVYAIEFP